MNYLGFSLLSKELTIRFSLIKDLSSLKMSGLSSLPLEFQNVIVTGLWSLTPGTNFHPVRSHSSLLSPALWWKAMLTSIFSFTKPSLTGALCREPFQLVGVHQACPRRRTQGGRPCSLALHCWLSQAHLDAEKQASLEQKRPLQLLCSGPAPCWPKDVFGGTPALRLGLAQD